MYRKQKRSLIDHDTISLIAVELSTFILVFGFGKSSEIPIQYHKTDQTTFSLLEDIVLSH